MKYRRLTPISFELGKMEKRVVVKLLEHRHYNILHSLSLNFLMKILLGDEFIHEITGTIKHSP